MREACGDAVINFTASFYRRGFYIERQVESSGGTGRAGDSILELANEASCAPVPILSEIIRSQTKGATPEGMQPAGMPTAAKE
jgi:hypothetical protein